MDQNESQSQVYIITFAGAMCAEEISHLLLLFAKKKNKNERTIISALT